MEIRIVSKFFLFGILTVSTSLSSVDLQNFYRPPKFQGETKTSVTERGTFIDASFSKGSARRGFDTEENKKDLFNIYGPTSMKNLAVNLEGVTAAAKPKTYTFKNGNATTSNAAASLGNGDIGFKGKFSLEEITLNFHQNIAWGLYGQIHLPIRKASISQIGWVQTATTDSDHLSTKNFVETGLDNVLAEYGIQPYQTPFNKTGLADALISVGWNGCHEISDSFLNKLKGFVQAGLLFPTTPKRDISRVFSVPLGYDKHWGFNARGNIDATIWSKLVVGANVGALVFMKRTYDMRLTTTSTQNGWMVLERGKASVDPGSIWDIGFYAKGERIFKGLSALAGYSYAQREKTLLRVKDSNFLKTALISGNAKSKDHEANSNKILHKWLFHTLHFYINYDFKAHSKSALAPLFEFSFNMPLLGKHSFNMDTYEGRVALSSSW